MTIGKNLLIAVLGSLVLTGALSMILLSQSTTGSYDPWADVSGPTPGVPDGTINMRDIQYEILHFNTFGTPIDRANTRYLAYDSGWINLAGETSLNYTLTHNLNLTSADMIVDARARQKAPSWNKTYGGTSEDRAEALVQTSDGGYALAGHTYSFGTGGSDFYLVKTDASGNLMWNKTYGGTGYENAHALVQTSDGGYALAGRTDTFVGGANFGLVKTDSSGNMLWNKTYGGTSEDRADALVQTIDGGYALAGYTYSFGTGGSDVYLVKTDTDGDLVVTSESESGLAWISSSMNSIMLVRDVTIPWGLARVRIWTLR